MSSVLTTREWNIRQKRIGTNHIVSYIRHKSEPILGYVTHTPK